MAGPSDTLPTVEVGPNDARAAVIWLHGLGADGYDFEPLVPHLGCPPDVRFVFPHAPERPVTINMGLVMRAWYDIKSLDRLRVDEDEAGILEASAQTAALVARERSRGVPAERIVVAGFSQGGAIALHAALRYPERLAGLLALSTYPARGDSLERERAAANRDLPVFGAHGRQDPTVPYVAGEAWRRRLEALGYTVEWHDYAIGHEVSFEEVRDIAVWLRARLPAA
jgi:phospholipase/carboxylesterase